MLNLNQSLSPETCEENCGHRTVAEAVRMLESTRFVRERAAGMMRALGEPGRLAVVELLMGGRLCVTEMAGALGAGISTVSERLKVLRTEGVITSCREGKHIYYSLADNHMSRLVSNLFDHAAESDDRRSR